MNILTQTGLEIWLSTGFNTHILMWFLIGAIILLARLVDTIEDNIYRYDNVLTFESIKRSHNIVGYIVLRTVYTIAILPMSMVVIVFSILGSIIRVISHLVIYLYSLLFMNNTYNTLYKELKKDIVVPLRTFKSMILLTKKEA